MGFEWSIQITWKCKAAVKHSIRWYNITKADKYFMFYFLISLGQVVYFQTVSSHSQKFFKIGVLKNFVKLKGKIPVLESLVNHPAARCFPQNETTDTLLCCEFCEFLKTTFLQNNFGQLPLSLWNVFTISINFILFSQRGFSRNKSLEAVVRRCSSK